MKRSIKAIICGIMMCAVMTTFAFAANNTRTADKLKDLGLFKGTATGYQLDRAPTRAEAAAMLVRLLGKESHAMDKNYSHPFSDVDEWASPYVGYMYENGLTNGIGNGKFGSSLDCSRQMYCTFALRSLGYSDEGSQADFDYNKAVDFAQQVGITNDDSAGILRDDVVAISYQALTTNMKGGNTALISKLINDGAVDKSKCSAILNDMELCKKCDQAFKRLEAQIEKGIHFEETSEFDAKSSDGKYGYSVKNFKEYKEISANGGNVQLSYREISEDSSSNDKKEEQLFLKDNVVYIIDQNGGKTKLSADEAKNEIEIIMSNKPRQDLDENFVAPFYQIKGVSSEKTSDGGEKITIELDIDAIEEYTQWNQIWSEMSVSSATAIINIGADGIIKEFSIENTLVIKDSGGVTFPGKLSQKYVIKSIGQNVTIQYPDLSAF